MISQKGAIPLLLLIAVVGVITLSAVFSIAPFKNGFLSTLFPKNSSFAAGNWILNSPDGSLKATLSQAALAAPYQSGERLYLKADDDGQVILEDSPLGLNMTNTADSFLTGLTFISRQDSQVNEQYQMKLGKKSQILNQANESVFKFSNASGKELEVVVRAYNDGVAYRYRLVGTGTYSIASEVSGFRLPAGAVKSWAQTYLPNGEKEYYLRGLPELTSTAGDWGYPVLVELVNNKFIYLAQAAVDGSYANLHFRGGGNNFLNFIYPTDQAGAITGPLPFDSPWRVVLTGTLANIVESDTIFNLNPPPFLGYDDSWIKSGRVAWSWWSDHSSPTNETIQRQYVDFAAEMGWEYILVDEGWNASWIPSLVSYANSKNVGVILWQAGNISSATASQYKNWGIKGVKLDFFDSDNQQTYKNYDNNYQISYDNQLILNLHGASKPAGEQRKWPHLLTKESVKGGEYVDMKNFENINYIFTRNILGSMDYTPVEFSANLTGSTAAAQLALAVLFESALQHFPDTPAAYRASPGKPFLSMIPTTWDDTKLIEGYPEQFVSMARKKGNNWYLGVNTVNSRNYQLPLSFLGQGTYQATIYKDGPTKTDILVESKTVTSGDTLTLPLGVNGGAAVSFTLLSSPNPSPSAAASPSPLKPGDVDNNGKVDIFDYNILLTNFGKTGSNIQGDIDGNSKVDIFDYNILLTNFGK